VPDGRRGDRNEKAGRPNAARGRWFLAQALEQDERLAWYSSYWGKPAFNREWLARQPWVGTAMLRRHTLGALRADPQAAILNFSAARRPTT